MSKDDALREASKPFPAPQPHDIGWAVKQLWDGKLVRRAGWNGKGMWLVLVTGTPQCKFSPGSPYAKAGLVQADIGSHVDMMTATGIMQPGWLCSQNDLLAIDWELALNDRPFP